MVTKGTYMAKVDLKSAYRQVPLSERSQNVVGIYWPFKGDNHDTYMIDTRLPFGAAKSVGIFHRITQSVCRMLKRMGINAIICFIDDFFISSDTIDSARRAINLLIHVLVSLGFAISWEKCVSPTTCLTFLGVSINTIEGTLAIPEKKLVEIKDTISQWHAHEGKVTKRNLQSLIGSLSWIARIIRVVRPCLRRLIDTMSSLKRPSHHTRITAQLRKDLAMLNSFCSQFNGTSFFLETIAPETAYIVTDSSIPGAAAALISNNAIIDWFYINWKTDVPCLLNAHINIKELAIIHIAIQRWNKLWSNAKLIVKTDNKCALYAINKGSTRNMIASDILVNIRIICALRYIRLVAVYINTKHNTLADSLSRLHHLPAATYALARVQFHLPWSHISPSAYKYVLQEWSSKRRHWISSG